MKVTFETMGTRQVDVHYVNSGVTGIVENFEGYYLENSGLSLDELFHQETVYQSLQTENKDRASASAINNSEPHHDQGAEEGESSRVGVIESQLALDEALARTLQVLEDHQLLAASLDETTETETGMEEEFPPNCSI
uniref:Uncharacterized protein n=1 Tax=Nelumbo nucifera TaxID=4432 RepID=A0A822XID3_NELNU|nr:TPA_asm: hypothetical protein HUJ06_020262 [Nelumbo nucifera]